MVLNDPHSSKIFLWFQNILMIPKYSYGNGWKNSYGVIPMVSKIFLWLGKFLWFHSHGFENIPMFRKIPMVSFAWFRKYSYGWEKSYGLENSYGFLKVLMFGNIPMVSKISVFISMFCKNDKFLWWKQYQNNTKALQKVSKIPKISGRLRRAKINHRNEIP